MELGILTTKQSEDGKVHITLPVAAECIQKRAVRYDKDGDNHYDTVSAFIKSMRGSDPDAALYYLARMLYAGEDVKFIARRIIICAAEDVGNADPNALTVAVSAAQAVERIGLPRARSLWPRRWPMWRRLPRATRPAWGSLRPWRRCGRKKRLRCPPIFRISIIRAAEKLGHGLGYKYAHDYPRHYVKQQYLPDGMEDCVFYEPTENGFEKQIREHMEWLKGEGKD